MSDAIALLQWGSRWQVDGLHAAWYHTDSQNSFAWARSGFASNDIAQELCRLIGALQAVYTLHMLPVWWPSAINLMADLLSRMLDRDGNVISSVQGKFEELNSALEKPYQMVEPNADVWNLIQWIQHVRGAFDELSEIRLFGEHKMLTLARGTTQSMAVRLVMFRETLHHRPS